LFDLHKARRRRDAFLCPQHKKCVRHRDDFFADPTPGRAATAAVRCTAIVSDSPAIATRGSQITLMQPAFQALCRFSCGRPGAHVPDWMLVSDAGVTPASRLSELLLDGPAMVKPLA
jgi:hypothetical protein